MLWSGAGSGVNPLKGAQVKPQAQRLLEAQLRDSRPALVGVMPWA